MSKQKQRKRRSGSPHINLGKGMNALDKVQAMERNIYDQKMSAQADFLLQIGCDAFILSNADLYDMQPGRVVEAVNTYRNYINGLMSHLIDDAASDSELVYFWTDLDRRLKQIVGDGLFVPREQRYDETGRRVFGELFRRYVERLKEATKMRTGSVKEMIAEMAVEAEAAEQSGQTADDASDTEQLEQSATAPTGE